MMRSQGGSGYFAAGNVQEEAGNVLARVMEKGLQVSAFQI